MKASMSQEALPHSCLSGRHRPRRVPIALTGGTLRTTCRDCGCAMVRTLATRRWFYSGPLT